MWTQIVRGKVGLSGNILVKSNIARTYNDYIGRDLWWGRGPWPVPEPPEAVRKWSRPPGYSARAPGIACEGRTALYCRYGPP